MASTSEFKGLIGPVALQLFGEPNRHGSSKTELRFGSHGSLAVDLEHDRFFDHERKEGGGVLDLVARETGQANGEAVTWLRDHGYDVGGEPTSSRAAPRRKRIEAVYDYTDETGELLFQAVRFVFVDERGQPAITKDGKVDKTFSQRRKATPDDDPSKVREGWVWSVKSIRLVPYRLPELLDSLAEERPFFIVEGEKKVDRLAKIGVCATCNSMGAGKWPESFGDVLRGADAIGLPDNDDAGRKHMDLVGANLVAKGSRFRLLELPGLPPKGDIVDWLDAGGTADALYALAESAARPFNRSATRSNFGAVWFADIDLAPPRRDWIVKNVLGGGEMGAMWGFAGSGKSFLALDLTLNVALATSGRVIDPQWFGHRVYGGGVVYVAPEGGQDLRLRIRAWREANGIPAGTRLPFVLLPTSVDLASSDGDTNALIAEIKMHAGVMGVPLRVVTIDTLARAMGGKEENSSEGMGAFIRNCERIQKETGSNVLPIHHAGNDRTKERGHTSLRAALDTSIEVAKPEEGGPNVWILRKLKSGKEGEKHHFQLKQIPIGVDDEGDPITSCVVTAPSEAEIGTASRGRAKPLSREARLALRALHDTLVDYSVPAPSSLGLPHGVMVVTRDQWRPRLIAQLVDPDEDVKGDKVRQRLRRARLELIDARVIGQNEPYFWIVREPSS